MPRLFSIPKLRALMAARHLTPYGLAKRIRRTNPHLQGCKTQTVDNWLHHGQVPTGNYVPAIAAALGVTMEDLYERTETVVAMVEVSATKREARLARP